MLDGKERDPTPVQNFLDRQELTQVRKTVFV